MWQDRLTGRLRRHSSPFRRCIWFGKERGELWELRTRGLSSGSIVLHTTSILVLVFCSAHQHPCGHAQSRHGYLCARLSRAPGTDTGTRRRRVEVRTSPLSPPKRDADGCQAQVRHATSMPGDPTRPPTRPIPSFQEPNHAQGPRYFAHVRVLSRLLHAVLSFDLLGYPAHRVCVRDAKEAFSVRPRFPDSFQYLVLDVQDSEEQNLIRLFPRFVQ
jgi:hypothetical protein